MPGAQASAQQLPAPVLRYLSRPDAVIEYSVAGTSEELVVLVPGLGRGIDDYRPVTQLLLQADFSVAAVSLRGVGGSKGSLQGRDLYTLAEDVMAVAEAQNRQKVHLVGYNLGNRIVRCAAVRQAARPPSPIASVTLLGAGGRVGPRSDAALAGRHFMESLVGLRNATRQEQLDAFRAAYLASDSRRGDEALEGWWPAAAFEQHFAMERTPMDWWSGGGVPLLVIQGLEDKLAPPENGYLLASERPGVEVADVPKAAHLLLMDQPQRVAQLLLSFLQKVRCSSPPPSEKFISP